MRDNHRKKSPRIIAGCLLLILIPLGFATKFYTGPFAVWVNNSLGGIFYEIFWCLVIFLFFPSLKAVWIAAIVFVATSALEFTQLWHAPFLEQIRENFIGRTLIGTSFTWPDFPYYAIGCAVGYFLLNRISGAGRTGERKNGGREKREDG
jgi:hypothetical protein